MRGETVITADPAGLTVREDGGRTVLAPSGDWLVDTVGVQDAAIRAVEENSEPGDIVIDLDGLGRIDTAGAYLLGRATRRCRAKARYKRLIRFTSQ